MRRVNYDHFTTSLRTALGPHAISLSSTDVLSLAAGQIYHLLPSDLYVEYHGILASCPNIILVRHWVLHATTSQLRCPTDPIPSLQHLSYPFMCSQQWHRLTTVSTARAVEGWACRRILHRTACNTPHPAQPTSTPPHPSIDAFVHDILAAQHASGTTYALFTDGSFYLSDLPLLNLSSSLSTREDALDMPLVPSSPLAHRTPPTPHWLLCLYCGDCCCCSCSCCPHLTPSIPCATSQSHLL